VQSSHPKIPIVFVTGEAALDKEQLAGIPCLSKPLTPDELMAAVNDAINLNEAEGG
jgi:CheY-like chemotaxis protein